MLLRIGILFFVLQGFFCQYMAWESVSSLLCSPEGSASGFCSLLGSMLSDLGLRITFEVLGYVSFSIRLEGFPF